MSNIDDQDDWSNDSASLFREARQAHDPTPAEAARLAAVLKRIQAQSATTALDAKNVKRAADVVAPAVTATSQVVKKVAGVSLGALCIAAASYAFIQLGRQPAEPARNEKPAPAAIVSAAPPSTLQPSAAPSGELEAPARPVAARDEAQPVSRSPRRRTRVATEKPRTSRTTLPAASDTVSSALPSAATALSTPQDSAAPPALPKPASPTEAATQSQDATPNEAEREQTLAATADKPETAPPKAPLTELALMKRMQGALREADFSTTLALCAEHARRWPHGVFQLEREGVRAIAACGENTDDAAQRARSFLLAHPKTPVAMRVSAACAAQLQQR